MIAEANRLEADLDALPQDASPHRTTAEEAIGRIRESAAPPGGVFERLMDWFGGARIERG